MDTEKEGAFNHIFNRFTIIDFLGYLVPGTLVSLYWEYCFGGIKAPFTSVFGDEPVMLALYFLMVSYLTGTVIHEFSKPLDMLFERRIARWMINRESEEKTKLYFYKIFSIDIDTADKKEVMERYQRIYHYIQPQLQNSKVPLFHAFSTFGRTGSLSMILMGVIYLAVSGLPQHFLWVVMALVVIACLVSRGYRFRKTMARYVYDYFDQYCGSLAEKEHTPSP